MIDEELLLPNQSMISKKAVMYIVGDLFQESHSELCNETLNSLLGQWESYKAFPTTTSAQCKQLSSQHPYSQTTSSIYAIPTSIASFSFLKKGTESMLMDLRALLPIQCLILVVSRL